MSSQPKKVISHVQSESLVNPQHNPDDTGLECKKCQRKFSNKRQISKHICFAELKDVPGDDDFHSKSRNSPCFDQQVTSTVLAPAFWYIIMSTLCYSGENPDLIEKEDEECTPKKVGRTVKSDKVWSIKNPESTGCTKNPIVSVVLAAHEAIPGKMIYSNKPN